MRTVFCLVLVAAFFALVTGCGQEAAPPEKVEKGRIQLKKLLAEDEIWQEEHKRIKQFEEKEKARRDAEHAEQQKEAPK